MKAPRNSSVEDIIRALTDREPVKVWSYLTTIFGDLAQEPGDELSGLMLSALTERIGIKPEAMRVAIHRLRKDNWIVARKQGRNSRYRLSERGLAETLRASRRIYAKTIDRPDSWHLVITDPASSDQSDAAINPAGQRDYLRISDKVFLGAGYAPERLSDVLALEFSSMTIPPWLKRDAVSAECNDAYMNLATLLTGVKDALDASGPLSVFERTTIRLLIIHHWRRAVLRHSPIVEQLFDNDWIGSVCRSRTARILHRLPRLSSEDLVAEIELAG